MLFFGTFHTNGMKNHVAFEGVGYDDKYDDD